MVVLPRLNGGFKSGLPPQFQRCPFKHLRQKSGVVQRKWVNEIKPTLLVHAEWQLAELTQAIRIKNNSRNDRMIFFESICPIQRRSEDCVLVMHDLADGDAAPNEKALPRSGEHE